MRASALFSATSLLAALPGPAPQAPAAMAGFWRPFSSNFGSGRPSDCAVSKTRRCGPQLAIDVRGDTVIVAAQSHTGLPNEYRADTIVADGRARSIGPFIEQTRRVIRWLPGHNGVISTMTHAGQLPDHIERWTLSSDSRTLTVDWSGDDAPSGVASGYDSAHAAYRMTADSVAVASKHYVRVFVRAVNAPTG